MLNQHQQRSLGKEIALMGCLASESVREKKKTATKLNKQQQQGSSGYIKGLTQKATIIGELEEEQAI